jgi:hypothetical protein
MNFDSDKRLGLVHMGRKGMGGNKTAGREREVSGAVIPTNKGTFTVASV